HQLGWICIDFFNNHYSFKASLMNWPSITYTEMYVLFTALLVSPHSSSINIFSDNQATINRFFKYVLNNDLSARKFEKIPNYFI
ncbi:16225_t:CDS:1, partial [Funneliformis mosseae]